ncbi:hypothetical protein INR49_015786 [Caranx melampygus]|nr:hypothetical protein INR49_015786 [Caranx melampygus]
MIQAALQGGAECESARKGRESEEPGEERSRPLQRKAAGMKWKINPSFPNSQTIPKLEQNSNQQRLRESV